MPEALSGVLATPGFWWLVLAYSVAGLVRGFTGFGTALIVMPVASTVLSPTAAVTVLVVSDLLGPLPNLPRAWRQGRPRDVLRLGIGAALAMPIGVWLLSRIPSEIFSWMVSLGVFALLALLMSGWRYSGTLTRRLTVVTGAVGGLLGGASGLAGPPVILLYMASPLPAAAIRATILMFLFVMDVMILGVLSLGGLIASGAVVAGLALAVPYTICNVIGARFFVPDRERLFRAVAYTIIAASALLGLPVWS